MAGWYIEFEVKDEKEEIYFWECIDKIGNTAEKIQEGWKLV